MWFSVLRRSRAAFRASLPDYHALGSGRVRVQAAHDASQVLHPDLGVRLNHAYRVHQRATHFVGFRAEDSNTGRAFYRFVLSLICPTRSAPVSVSPQLRWNAFSRLSYCRIPNCPIPDDHIDPHRPAQTAATIL